MPKQGNPFRCRFRTPAIPKMAVYKIWVDDQFLVWKGRSLTQSVSGISAQIDRCIRKPPSEPHLLEKLITAIEVSRALFVEIEVVKYVLSPYDMLKLEHETLLHEKNNPKCLNVSFEPYIPKWIPITHLEAYYEFIKNQ